MIKEIIFKCSYQPNYLTLHALFATIFDNKHQNKDNLIYKIFYKDKSIYLYIDNSLLDQINIQDNYSFKHRQENRTTTILIKKIKEEEFQFSENKNGEIVKVYGFINYGINKGEKGIQVSYGSQLKKINKVCPIDQFGNFIEGTRQKTLKYLEERTGLDLLTNPRNQSFKYINPLNFNNHHQNKEKIQFHDVFFVSLEGVITNETILNKLYYSSIGQKRNYGFGNLFIEQFK